MTIPIEKDIDKRCDIEWEFNDSIGIFCMLKEDHPGHHYWFDPNTKTQISWSSNEKVGQ